MARVERMREVLQGPLDSQYIGEKDAAGWKPVAVEWEREREVETRGERLDVGIFAEAVPFGLRVANDCLHLEENPAERRVLVEMMDLIVQDYPLSRVAEELNRRGFRTREGGEWQPVEVFNMLPRLIEVGPHIFSSEEWTARRQHLLTAQPATDFPRRK